jgi:hypothetical protein
MGTVIILGTMGIILMAITAITEAIRITALTTTVGGHTTTAATEFTDTTSIITITKQRLV